jgi:3-oxoadipate enol-lactonase
VRGGQIPQIEVPDARLNVADSGDTGSPTLVFVHGNVMNLHMWDALVEALKTHFRCIRWDLRLHGETVDNGETFTYWDAARDGLAVLDHLGVTSAAWIGHSQGGFTALRAALLAPERVERLVLIDTTSHAFDEDSLTQMGQIRDGFAAGETDSTARILLQLLLGSPRHEQHWLPQLVGQGGSRTAEAISALMAADDVTDRTTAITQPALVIHGRGDIPIPAALGEELARDLAGSGPAVVIDGAGHTPPVTHVQQTLDPITHFCG